MSSKTGATWGRAVKTRGCSCRGSRMCWCFRAKAKGGPLPLEPTSTEAQTSQSKATGPQKFTVDRPFLFLVMNKNPDAILVLGSVKRLSSKKTKNIP
ncbi:hypothetical protein HPB48_022922 [Haemaphysalis longicornis]|uniref:Serpin domain-containing protein n=1 Tax=Haemaphysalis longicornis TaxID=44386 RepID=A0A9J6GBU9_HAELO|nr:hypothetical protein HPB48_022922 [Haemaphysalis longicornis]